MARTFSPAESDFERILRQNDFMTASLKADVKAPSIEDGTGFYVILPDIVAIDKRNGQGWCFEVKDETTSKSKMDVMELGKTRPYGGGYSGPVWMLERRKAMGYLDFSGAFDCPCVIAIRGVGGWRAGFFTIRRNGQVEHNWDVVASKWQHYEGRIPVMFDRLIDLGEFLFSVRARLPENWQ